MAAIDIYRNNLLRKLNKYATLPQKKMQISSEIVKTVYKIAKLVFPRTGAPE
jgi:hypothetical protein